MHVVDLCEHDLDGLADLDRGGVDLVDRAVGARDQVADEAQGRVLVDIKHTLGASLQGRVAELGGNVTYASPGHSSVRAWMPLGRLEDLAGDATVLAVRPALQGMNRRAAVPGQKLRRWDELCQKAPHAGIAANDAHQNIGLVVRLTEDKKARFEDAAGKKLLELDAGGLAEVGGAPKDAKPGDVLFEIRLDPYENSLRHVGTHLLMKDLSQPAVWEALEHGRAFVAFDWLADATGFDFAARSGDERYEIASPITAGEVLPSARAIVDAEAAGVLIIPTGVFHDVLE